MSSSLAAFFSLNAYQSLTLSSALLRCSITGGLYPSSLLELISLRIPWEITGPGADRVPVTLLFVDLHHTHHPDMVVQFQGTQVVFQNVHGTFQPAQS